MAKLTQLIFEMLETEKPRLFQYASYRLHDIKDVEDILQNLYVKFLSDPKRFDNVSDARSYIYRVLHNDCCDMLRNLSKTCALDIESFETLDSESMQPDNFEEEFALINRLLNLLPEEQSETIRLRLHSGLQYQEIAEIMDVGLSTAKARFRYGIEKVRDRLKKEKLL